MGSEIEETAGISHPLPPFLTIALNEGHYNEAETTKLHCHCTTSIVLIGTAFASLGRRHAICGCLVTCGLLDNAKCG